MHAQLEMPLLNLIWLSMIIISVVVGLLQGRINNVVHAATDAAKLGFELALGLTGVMALWLGIMEIAKESGLMDRIASFLRPVMKRLFPDIPVADPAIGAMSMNIAANMLGLGNAATPFGLRAMQELQRLNTHAHVASNAMCTFLAINTSSVQLIPATAIAYLSANGSAHPNQVIVSALIATCASTLVAIISVKFLAKLPMYQIRTEDE